MQEYTYIHIYIYIYIYIYTAHRLTIHFFFFPLHFLALKKRSVIYTFFFFTIRLFFFLLYLFSWVLSTPCCLVHTYFVAFLCSVLAYLRFSSRYSKLLFLLVSAVKRYRQSHRKQRTLIRSVALFFCFLFKSTLCSLNTGVYFFSFNCLICFS